MKDIFRFLFAVVLIVLLGLPTPVQASYDNYINIRVYNNSSDALGATPVLVSMNNSQLIVNGYMNSTALNTNMVEVGDRTYMVEKNMTVIYAPSFAGYQQRYYYYRLNNEPGQTGFPLMTGLGGNVTTSDSPTLELGWYFAWTMENAYLDTSGDSSQRYLVYKGNSFVVENPSPGAINATIYPRVYFNSASVGDPTPGWNNDAWADDGSTTTTATTTAAIGVGAWSTFLTFNRSTTYMDYFRYYEAGLGQWADQIDVDMWYDGDWHDFYLGDPGTFNSWNYYDAGGVYVVDAARVRLRNGGGAGAISLDIYEVDFGYLASIQATGISSGEHDISIYSTPVFFSMEIDGVTEVSEPRMYASCEDNGNDWYFIGGNSTVYTESIELYPNAVWKLYYTPQMIVDAGVVLNEISMGNNEGEINWGNNPEYLEVSIGELDSYFDLSGTVGGAEPPAIFTTPDTTGVYPNLSASTGPLHGIMDPAAGAMSSPVGMWYKTIGFLIGVALFIVGAVIFHSPMIGALLFTGALGAMAGMGYIGGAEVALDGGVLIVLTYMLRRF